MELRDLRSFVAVAQHRNFSRAAEQLHVSQPALSEQIRKLEDELGAPLFDRTSRGATLTAAGEAFLPQARSVLAQADVAAETVRMVSAGLAGTLTLGFIDSAALGILPPLIRRFTARYPAVKLRLRELGTRRQLEAVEAGEIDVGIVRGPVWNPALAGRRIATESLLLALPEEHRLAGEAAVRLADLRDEGFITYPADRGAGLYEETLRLCHEAGFEPKIVQEANEIYTIIGMVAAGLGVAIVPDSVSAIAPGGVVYRPTEPRAELERWAVWREEAPLAVVQAFVTSLPLDGEEPPPPPRR
ncbi:MAG TPA: LysR substrate-binding domain-containing protein [Candidatus Elarobacter sp.]|jgi:DNA-binding transcriptional LysR family regulator|nr:LysR substrate-binding domain-containing protein [Candidatus Elarobacter sp.]